MMTSVMPVLAGLDSKFEKQIKEKLKIEHIFSRFSSDCGPGTIIQYTNNSNYIMAINPWDAIGVTKAEYFENIDVQTPVSGLVSNLTQVVNVTIGFDLGVSSMSSKSKNSVKVRLILNNGVKHTLLQTDAISRICDNVKCAGLVQNALIDIRENMPGVKLFIVKEVYAYDYEYQCEWNSEWTAITKLPPEILNIVGPQVGIENTSASNIQSTGKGYFIGFNGYPMNKRYYKIKSVHTSFPGKQKNDKRIIPNLVDITDLIKP
jgi:hypothetical protein